MKNSLHIITFCALVVLVPVADVFPSGAASQACVTMAPRHRSTTDPDLVIAPQESISPYSIVAEGTTYTPGGTVSVSILAKTRDITFQGFLIQARTVGSPLPVGSFLAGTDGASKLLSCNATGDSITHTGPEEKQSGMSFTWQAPAASVGKIQFILAAVKNHDVYWVRMESNTLSASASLSASMPMLCFLLAVTMATNTL
ncbi:putative defense protein 1 [Acanthaster planci]|uniref:Defense protein 1 n=1 Tax=Acanthaster planci TaxID=133434 RepID=A0A8B7Z3Z9_ACAPL|nr:putative defense protein 1 [Acanthaster planci]